MAALQAAALPSGPDAISRNAVIRTLSIGFGIRVRSQANIPKISFQPTDPLEEERFVGNEKHATKLRPEFFLTELQRTCVC